jgi:hypothetical protein
LGNSNAMKQAKNCLPCQLVYSTPVRHRCDQSSLQTN